MWTAGLVIRSMRRPQVWRNLNEQLRPLLTLSTRETGLLEGRCNTSSLGRFEVKQLLFSHSNWAFPGSPLLTKEVQLVRTTTSLKRREFTTCKKLRKIFVKSFNWRMARCISWGKRFALADFLHFGIPFLGVPWWWDHPPPPGLWERLVSRDRFGLGSCLQLLS